MKNMMRIIWIVALIVSIVGVSIYSVIHLFSGELLLAALESMLLATLAVLVYFDKSVKRLLMAEYFNLVVTFEGIKAKYRGRR